MFKYSVSIRYFAVNPASVCYIVVAKNRCDAIHLALADLKAERVASVEVFRIVKEISNVKTDY
jgi:hypothetical protein